MKLSSSVNSVSPSITLQFNQRVLEKLARGEDVIKLTAGEPDFPTPEPISEAAISAIKEGKTKYTASAGIAALREKIAQKLAKDNNLSYSAEEIVVSNGGKQAIYNSLKAILEPGDEVILISPAWVSYEAQVKLCDGIPVYVKAFPEDAYIPKLSKIEEAFSERTKAIIINSPNNPTGSVYPEEYLKELSELLKKHGIIVISDEVYEKLAFDEKHVSIASFEGMKELAIVINAFSKAYSMTGWRIGYLAAKKEIAKAVTKIQGHSTSNVNTIAQYAALKALDVETGYMVKEFIIRRDYVGNRLKEMGLKFFFPKGAFYFFVDIRDYLGKGIKDSFEFCVALLEKAGVGMIPGSAFNAEGFIRLSYASSIEELEKGLDRLEHFMKTL
ncbi:aspartate aminotransferase [Kosmotoga arenicorallina S304]|uniref:Aspartate aminotransferase n=1 Tax=Kosmotoga arenicorallina S304 TaxID=1453497 RepID=A0A176K1B8_9BACT|nr:aspartate aminotransferase [Kosmotoga arenicorallina]OAA30890.1 aspartate aminotransferase [Kosmotoga arenicorallina S304]